jgi:DNA-binding transcriptional MerR regulator
VAAPITTGEPPKLYKIGEVMRYSGLSRQTLHNYTMLGLISPATRTESGHRLYDASVFERIKKIEMLKRHRTLTEVKALLDEQDRAAEGS